MSKPDSHGADDIANEFSRRLVRVRADARESLFLRTSELGYEARVRGLSAAENAGEAAVVVDPIESPLWYVGSADGFLSDPDDPGKLLAIIEDVITWTNEVVAQQDTSENPAETRPA